MATTVASCGLRTRCRCRDRRGGRPGGLNAPDAQALAYVYRDLLGAVQDALALGAELPEHQPQDDVRVLLDVRPRIISITSHATVAPPSPKGDRWTLPPMGR